MCVWVCVCVCEYKSASSVCVCKAIRKERVGGRVKREEWRGAYATVLFLEN